MHSDNVYKFSKWCAMLSTPDAIRTLPRNKKALLQRTEVLFEPGVDLRDTVPLTRHILRFEIPLTSSTESNLRNPDKDQLRADILAMCANGMSYRQIATALGIHWTRVGQIVRN